MSDLLIECFNCNKEVTTKGNYFFCANCLVQIKCKSCGELLLRDARGCTSCGAPIVETEIMGAGAVNKIEFEQKGDSKKFMASFTNHIGESLVQSLGGLFIGSGGKLSSNPFAPKFVTPGNPKQHKKDIQHEEAYLVNSLGDSELNEILKLIFRVDDDKLILINQRVKHSGKRDQAIRISLLLLYAYALIEQKQILRSTLNDVLEHAKVYDTNFKGWIANCDEISKLDSGAKLELSLPGTNAAKAIIQEIADDAIEAGSVAFSGTRVAKRKRAGKMKGEMPDGTPSRRKTTSSKFSPLKAMEDLISGGYFSQRRKLNDIISYCKDHEAIVITNSVVGTTMARLVKIKKIKREKNGEGQYEYYI